MKIAFHILPVCHRGTTTATLDYAKYNEQILGNESIILINENLKQDLSDPGITPQDKDVVQYVKDNYKTISYNDFSEIEFICKDNNITHIYSLKYGKQDGFIIPNIKNLVHVVFNVYDPHGDEYAYVSEWLARTASNNRSKYVPHIVSLPPVQKSDWRKKLNIPEDAIIIGRYGGLYQFDIGFAIETVYKFALANPNYYFLFVNTFNFFEVLGLKALKNIIFIPPIVDLQDKTDFILSCDAMIHARSDGESFGLAICEGLFHDKPVFCFNGGRDKHHIDLLKDTNLLYNNPLELYEKLLSVHNYTTQPYSNLVDNFSPYTVMQKFQDVFLR